MSAESLVAEARSQVDDVDLGPVHAWKRANPGGLAVGTMPIYVPRPLIEAVGALPVAIFGYSSLITILWCKFWCKFLILVYE